MLLKLVWTCKKSQDYSKRFDNAPKMVEKVFFSSKLQICIRSILLKKREKKMRKIIKFEIVGLNKLIYSCDLKLWIL